MTLVMVMAGMGVPNERAGQCRMVYGSLREGPPHIDIPYTALPPLAIVARNVQHTQTYHIQFSEYCLYYTSKEPYYN